jgi:hypothetical protein
MACQCPTTHRTRRCGHGLLYCPGGDHCAHGFHSTASTPLNEEGAFDGDVVEAQLAHDTEKEALVARRGSAAPAWQGPTRTRSAASVTVLSIGPDACV